jgi:hypothetical protein
VVVGFILKAVGGDLRTCLLMIGALVCASMVCALLVRFDGEPAQPVGVLT